MKFFIPQASSDAEAESVLVGIAKFVGADVPPPDKRIFKLAFSHNGKDFAMEVGKPVPPYFGSFSTWSYHAQTVGACRVTEMYVLAITKLAM